MRPTIIHAAFAVLVVAAAAAADAQTTGTRTIEVGPGAVSDGSYKAGEYNGLQNQGAFGIGNVDLRGGNAGYNSDATRRWRVTGRDLGLDTRSLFAEIGEQGRFKLSAGFDAVRRNRSDTYQTPYLGAGTNVLTLPSTWLVPTVAGSSASSTAVNTVSARGLVPSIGTAPYINTATNSAAMGALLSPNASQLALVNAAAAADNPLFHTYDLYTKRQAFNAAFTYNLDARWAADASIRPEHKSGTKPMGTVSRNTGGDISTTIPDLVDSNHTQANAGLNFRGERAFLQTAYYGSFYRNNVPSMSWQNWATAAGTLNTMSSAPNNDFNQFHATAGVNVTPTTKLVANAAYGRATQNDTFLTDSTTPVVPVSSLDGRVVTTALNAKLSARPTKKLTLAAGYKYDNRDNRTSVHVFQYADAGEAPVANAAFPAGATNPLGAVLAQNANANRPYSRKVNQANGEADYQLARHEWVKAGYEFERIGRWCDGTWIDCVDAGVTNESTVRGEWRTTVAGAVSARVNYAYASRRAPDYNENAFLALVPYANVSPAGALGNATAYSFMTANGWTGYGPIAGYTATTGNMNLFFPGNNALANAAYANNNRISELPGMRRYYVADRDRHKLRSSLGWQATDALSLQAAVDLTNDAYPNSTYGVQSSKGWAVNLDGGYAFAENVTADVYYNLEDGRSIAAGNSYTANSNAAAITNGQPGVVGLSGNGCDGFTTMQQRNNNNKIDPCLNWSADMVDRVHTAGVGVRARFGALDLTGNVLYSHSRWNNTVAGGNWANNLLNGPGAAPTSIAAYFIAATPVPTTSTDSGEARIVGTYAIDRVQALRLSYVYTRMRSSDLIYEGMQFGSVSSALPTNEQPFAYSINTLGISYVLTF